jgi:hypothetical protein
MTGQPKSPDLRTLVDTYVRHAVARRDEDFWAWDAVGDVVRGEDPERAFSIVQELVRAVPDHQLEYVGAGPVEELVTHHSAALVAWLEGEARRDPRFREALASVWLIADHIRPDVLARLQAATGNRIRVATQAELDAAREEHDRPRDHDA